MRLSIEVAAVAKQFFNLEFLMDVFCRVNGSYELTAENWKRYINSEELQEAARNFLLSITTEDVREDIACCGYDCGIEIYTATSQVFPAAPELTREETTTSVQAFTMRFAIRGLIAAINHIFFAAMSSGREFVILCERSGKRLRLNNSLNYEEVPTAA